MLEPLRIEDPARGTDAPGHRQRVPPVRQVPDRDFGRLSSPFHAVERIVLLPSFPRRLTPSGIHQTPDDDPPSPSRQDPVCAGIFRVGSVQERPGRMAPRDSKTKKSRLPCHAVLRPHSPGPPRDSGKRENGSGAVLPYEFSSMRTTWRGKVGKGTGIRIQVPAWAASRRAPRQSSKYPRR